MLYFILAFRRNHKYRWVIFAINIGFALVARVRVARTPVLVAATLLSHANLTLGAVTYQSSATLAPGIILGESPAAGTIVTAGSSINLVVSSGPALVTVPNLVEAGQTRPCRLCKRTLSPRELLTPKRVPPSPAVSS